VIHTAVFRLEHTKLSNSIEPVFANSLVAALTDATRPPRPFKLSKQAGVICLSRALYAVNRMKANSMQELADRRESAAIIVGLRLRLAGEIEKETARSRS
jgi:hypothetical protein